MVTLQWRGCPAPDVPCMNFVNLSIVSMGGTSAHAPAGGGQFGPSVTPWLPLSRAQFMSGQFLLRSQQQHVFKGPSLPLSSRAAAYVPLGDSPLRGIFPTTSWTTRGQGGGSQHSTPMAACQW